MNYYPFHIGDYASHTGDLSMVEDLAYRRLLDRYYLTEKPLPLDVAWLAKKIRMKGHEADVESVLEEFFDRTEDGWRNDRADEEIERMQEKQEAAEQRDDHEKTRMQKHRERRSAMFAALADVGVYLPWNAKTGELESAMKSHGITRPVTPPRSNDVTAPVTAPVTPVTLPATAIPTPTPTPTPTPKKKEEGASAFVLPDWVPAEAWAGYVEMRRKIRKPMTDRARELRIADLAGFMRDGHDIEAILNKSTANNWTDVYAPKPDQQQQRNGYAPSGETAYQRQQRERMQAVAPSIAAKAPGQPKPQTEIFDVTPKRLD